MSQFYHLQDKDNISAYLIGLWGGLNQMFVNVP